MKADKTNKVGYNEDPIFTDKGSKDVDNTASRTGPWSYKFILFRDHKRPISFVARYNIFPNDAVKKPSGKP